LFGSKHALYQRAQDLGRHVAVDDLSVICLQSTHQHSAVKRLKNICNMICFAFIYMLRAHSWPRKE
jgi:hypothetical protein